MLLQGLIPGQAVYSHWCLCNGDLLIAGRIGLPEKNKMVIAVHTDQLLTPTPSYLVVKFSQESAIGFSLLLAGRQSFTLYPFL